MKIERIIDKKELDEVCKIAWATWPVCYKELLTAEQIEYMLQLFYTPEQLDKNCFQKGHLFYLLKQEDQAIGFASIELNHQELLQTKLHKLYVLPGFQQLGAGKMLFNEMITIAKDDHQQNFTLHVNRGNPAISFYEKWGFEIIKEEDFDIGKGHFMNDFLMRKTLNDLE